MASGSVGRRPTRRPGCRSPPRSTAGPPRRRRRRRRPRPSVRRRPSRHRPRTHRDRAARQQALELGSVAVLGRAEEPVGGADGLGQGDAAGHVLAGDGPGRLEQQPVAGADARGHGGSASRSPPGGRRRRRRCGSRWRRSRGRPARCRLRSLTVTWTQAGIVGRRGAAGEARPLPGQVVVVQHGRAVRRSTPATAAAAPGLRGSEQRFSTTTRSAPRGRSRSRRGVGGSAASMARPGRRWSTGPAPATVRTSKPRARGAPPIWPPPPTPRRSRRGGTRRWRRPVWPRAGHPTRDRHGADRAAATTRAGRYRRCGGRPAPTLPPLTSRCSGRRRAYQVGGAWPGSPSTGPSAATPCPGSVMRGLRGALADGQGTTPTVRVVVLTGAGDEAFCAGADLGGMGEADERRGRVPRSPRGPGRARRGVPGAVASGQADHRPGPGLGHGRGVRPGARLRPGGGLGPGPLRCPRDQRRPLAVHDHRPPGPLDAAEEGARADAHRPGGGRRRGRAHRVRDQGRAPRRARRGGGRAGRRPWRPSPRP